MITKANTYFESYTKKELSELIERKNSLQDQLYALEHIERTTKKDGSDFKSFLANFKTTSDRVFIRYAGACGLFGNYIRISYNMHSIDLQDHSINEDFIEQVKKTQPERVISESYLKDRVYFTPSEFMQEIEKNIARIKKSIVEYEDRIKNFEKDTNEMFEKMIPLLEFLDSKKDHYYEFKQIASDTIKNFYSR